MPKVTDIKAYWSELAKKAGIADEDVKPFLEALDKEQVRKTFTDGFKPLPDYSHDLDDVRARTKADKDKEYADWFAKEQEKYKVYLESEAKAKRYEELYGSLDGAPPVTTTPPAGGTTLTKEDIDRLLDAKLNDTLSRRDSAVLDLLEVH